MAHHLTVCDRLVVEIDFSPDAGRTLFSEY
jgi:hypothetical protein